MATGIKVASLYADLSLDDAKFKSGAAQAEARMKTMGQQAQDAARSFTTFAKNATVAIGVFSGVAKGAYAWSQVGRASLESQIALEKYVGSAEEAAKWTKAVSDAMGGAVTQGQAAAQAFMLAKFGFTESAAGAEDFLRTIRIMTAVSPQIHDTDTYLQQLQLTLANTSFMRLDQLGLTTAQVKERMEELQAATANLSREEAFQQAVLLELADEAAVVGDEILQVGDDMDWLMSQGDKLTESIGVWIHEGFEGWASAIRSIDEAVKAVGWAEFLEETVSQVTGIDLGGLPAAQQVTPGDWQMASAMGMDIGDFLIWRDEAEKTRQAASLFTDEAEALGDALSTVNLELKSNDALGWVDAWNAAFSGITPALMEVGGGGYGYGGIAREVTLPDVRNQISDLTDLARATTESATAELELAAAMDDANRAMIEQGEIIPSVRQAEFDAMIEAMSQPSPYGEDWVATLATDQQQRQADFDAMIRSMGQAGEDLSADLAPTLATINDELERFSSLAEKFGTDQADAFDVDVYNEMAAAMREAGVATEDMEQAMLNYQLATGMATGASLLFDEQMANLAEQLEEGSITADEYVQSVLALGELDLSAINIATEGMTPEQIQAYVDSLADLDLEELQALLAGGAEEGAISPLGPLVEDLETVKNMTAEAAELWGEPIADFYTTATTESGAFREEAVEDIAAVEQRLRDMMAEDWNIVVSVTTQGEGIDWKPPEFAEGGYTGAGTNPFLAMLHPDEYVIPGGVMRSSFAGAGLGGGQTVVVQLDSQVLFEAYNREGARRNIAVYAG